MKTSTYGYLRLDSIKYFRDDTVSTFYPSTQFSIGALDFDRFAEYAVSGINWLARRMIRRWVNRTKAPALSPECEIVFTGGRATYRIKVTRKDIRIFASRK